MPLCYNKVRKGRVRRSRKNVIHAYPPLIPPTEWKQRVNTAGFNI